MYAELELDLLELSPLRPSSRIPDVTPSEIAAAEASGFVQPIVVRALKRPHGAPNVYEIIEGEKSWILAQRAGLKTILAQVTAIGDERVRQKLKVAGVQQKDTVAECEYLGSMVRAGTKAAEVAAKVGKTRSVVAHASRLEKAAPIVLAQFRRGALTFGHIKPLLSLPHKEQERLGFRVEREHLSCRETERLAESARKGLFQPSNTGGQGNGSDGVSKKQ